MTDPLSRALATIRGNLSPQDALASANTIALAGLADRPKFADGGYTTTDAGGLPPTRPWSETDGGPFRPSPNEAPQGAHIDLLGALLRAHGIQPNPSNIAHALAVISGQREAAPSAGAFARGGRVDPLKGRPHFENGGASDRGYSGSDDDSDSIGSGSWSSGYGGFGTAGISTSSGSYSSNSGSYSSSGSYGGNTSGSHGSGGSFNSGSAAGSSTGGYGGFGGYSSSASVGGSYGGGSSYSSSNVSSSNNNGSYSSSNGGYGSVSGSLGQNTSNAYGGSMSSSSNSSTNNGGYGGLSGVSSYSPSSGFGNFNSSNTGSGVGNTSSGGSSSNSGSGYGGFSSGAASGADSLSSALGTVGSASSGTYGGYRGAGTSYSGTQDGYGTNVAVAASDAQAAQQASQYGAIAASGGFKNITDNATDMKAVGADFGLANTAHQVSTEGDFGDFGKDKAVDNIGMFDSDLSKLGYGSFQTPAATSYANANSLAGSGVTPGIANTGEGAARDAFSAGVNAGAAMESGMAGSGLTDANAGLETHVGALSPSIRAAMGSYADPGMDTAAGSAIPGATATRQAAATNWGNIHTGTSADPSTSASTDPAGALTVHGPYAGVTTADALGAGPDALSSFGGMAGLSMPGSPGQLTAAQQAQMDAYSTQHQALAAKTQAMADGIDGAGMFSGMVGQFLGAEPTAVKGWLSNPEAHPDTAAAMTARMNALQAESDAGQLNGMFGGGVDQRGLAKMMEEGGYSSPTDAINAAKGFIDGKMNDVAPHFSAMGTPGFNIGSAPSMGSNVASGADSFGVSGGLSPSISAAAGLTAAADPSTVDGTHALTVHGPLTSTGFDGNPTANPSGWDNTGSALGAVPAGAPVGMRNMNLGNIGYGGWAAAHGAVDSGARDVDHNIAQFSSQEDGIRAAADLAGSKYAAGRTTADSLVAGAGGWTPGNHQAAANIAASMGIGPNDDLGLNTQSGMTSFLGALATQEHGAAGKSYYSRDAISNALGYGSSGPDAADDTRNFAIQGLQNTAMTAPAGVSSPYSAGMPGVGMSDASGPFGSLQGASGSLPSFAAADRALTAANVPGYTATGDATMATSTASPTPAVTGDVAKKADDLSTAQKVAKMGINAGLGLIPGVGPVLAAGNALSGLLGYGTIGEYLARNASAAQVGSPAMAGADHSSAAYQGSPLWTGYGYGSGSGYGALDPSVTGSTTNAGAAPVDPNAAARTAMAAMGGTGAGSSPTIAAAANGNTSVGSPNAATSSGVSFYDPMRDPVVLAAFAKLRAA